ncbi:MAG: single-stranded DNA-binding protein [Alphaproteobacteria bacterium]|nr:single-stranded DNA-binding protein [Alphaproteobacteria bacterium]
MAGSINKVTLVGNLGRDPEIRHTATGQKIAHLSVATSETWKDKSGERQERTEWHRVVIFNANLADFSERFLKKGSKVYVEGALQTRKFTDQSGQDRYTTEVVLGAFRGELVVLDGRSDGSSSSLSSDAGSSSSGWDATSLSGGTDSFDDEIPF